VKKILWVKTSWIFLLLLLGIPLSGEAGGQYEWSENLTVGCAYELLWMGDLDMDLNRGPLAGQVSGTYEETAMHFINFNLIWKY
jgi:hypothetical protein